ncbi:hypothetical protein BpHYR1_025041 [Brachionus plicatilis]|uniref:Uncharacterized protein n=1 Tax=Brachionus plicatilis TaxID=10195 RepID=A0A3M7RP47_BRAPC|nr:hypothetical protein BpHYR1_025041 [Brachionus plicatilis]
MGLRGMIGESKTSIHRSKTGKLQAFKKSALNKLLILLKYKIIGQCSVPYGNSLVSARKV